MPSRTACSGQRQGRPVQEGRAQQRCDQRPLRIRQATFVGLFPARKLSTGGGCSHRRILLIESKKSFCIGPSLSRMRFFNNLN